MSEWDTGSPGLEEPGAPSGKREGVGTGGLHWPMSIACLIVVAAVSFGVAWLMKDRVRTLFEMGLTFAAPFAALMFSAILTEKYTGGMVPACSRKAQLMFASGTIAAAFIFGCLAEVVHKPVVIEHFSQKFDFVIVEDKSGSMRGTAGRGQQSLESLCREAMHSLVDGMEDETRVGFVAFASDIVGKTDIRKLDRRQRAAVRNIIESDIPSIGGGTDFSNAMAEVMVMIDKDRDSTRPVRIILVTDGDNVSIGNFERFKQWAAEKNRNPQSRRVELSAIQIGPSPMLGMVKDAVNHTGGKIFDRTDAEKELTRNLGQLQSEVVKDMEAVDSLKATYEGDRENSLYKVVCAVLLLLLGLLCGISLRIMFSLRGQFRFQMILGPLMGLAAFALLNWGKALGIEPPWVCEGIAFSLFGLVFMRKNSSIGRSASLPEAAPAGSPAEDWNDRF